MLNGNCKKNVIFDIWAIVHFASKQKKIVFVRIFQSEMSSTLDFILEKKYEERNQITNNMLVRHKKWEKINVEIDLIKSVSHADHG